MRWWSLVAAIALFSLPTARPEPVCVSCHPQQTAAFLRSPMGRSVSPATPLPGGMVRHGSTRLSATEHNNQLIHRVDQDGHAAEYPVAYQVGAGLVGSSFLVRVGPALFQSPLSQYKSHGWDLTPGYETEKKLDFDLPATSDCLFCHTSSIKLAEGTRNSYAEPAFEPISCERCHGPSELHLLVPLPGSIVNPAKLPMRQRDSVCEQCHLHADQAVLNPAKDWWDFQAGQPLEQVATLYLHQRSAGQPKAVGQVEQLALSKCARQSRGRLWCGSCHDPHPRAGRPARDVRQVCESCHGLQRAAAHPAASGDCVACHMPATAARDVAHAAITDHRIRIVRPANEPANTDPLSGPLVAWKEPEPQLHDRNLGLAYLGSANASRSVSELRQGYELLRSSKPSLTDSPALIGLGSVLLHMGQSTAAESLFAQASANEPSSAAYHRYWGVALRAKGNWKDALVQLELATKLDPYDYSGYEELAATYRQLGQPAAERQVRERFLRAWPRSLRARD